MLGEGAATGALIGGILGAGAALLIPGIGPILAGGILATALGTAAVGAATGGVIGALAGLGVSEDDARHYEGEVTSGRALVTVKARDRFAEARSILEHEGARDVRGEGTTLVATDTPPPPTRALGGTSQTMSEKTRPRPAAPANASGEMRIPMAEETLVTHAQKEHVGEVVVRKDIIEEQRSLDVPVTNQEVTIERRTVDRDLKPGETAFQAETSREMRVPVYEEHVSVEKRAHVVEEVIVKPVTVTEHQHITETVRREVPHVEQTGDTGQLVHGGNTMAGQTTGSGFRPWSEVMPTYQSDWRNRYGASGGPWTDVEPAYRYGYESYHDPRYANRSWTVVEPELKRDWERRYSASPWERVKESIASFWSGVQRTV